MEDERYVGQRGPDKEPREFNPKSLLNLKQFQKPVSEANLSTNSGMNWTKIGIIGIFVLTLCLIIWKRYNKKKNNAIVTFSNHNSYGSK